MKLRHQKIFKKSLSSLFNAIEKSYLEGDFDAQLISLSDLVNYFRPASSPKSTVSIEPLLVYLKGHPEQQKLFTAFLYQLIYRKAFKNILADAGILQTTHLRSEIKSRLISSIIPNQPKKETLGFVLNQVFYKSSDIIWIKKIPFSELEELFDILGFDTIYQSVEPQSPISEIFKAIRFTMQRMSGRALEADVIKMLPEYEDLENPFIALERNFEVIENKIVVNASNDITEDDLDNKHLQVLLKQCNEYVDKAFSNSSKYGISMNVNQSLLRIRQQLERLETIIPFLYKKEDVLNQRKKTIELALLLIRYNCFKNNVKKMFNEGIQLISYEITQHTAKTGEHYITKGLKEYKDMLISASLGGVIVGVMCITKLLLSKIHVSDFGHAALYSLNYALGFTAIYLLGGTLATKQPAMTAAALIQSIEKGEGEKDIYKKYKAFGELFARLFRSQFIAFVGNVFLAFPISLLIVYAIQWGFHTNIAEAKALKLLTDNSPVHSPAIFHAAIAGVFLFLSGIISGNVANSNRHNQLYYRISEHPVLKMSFGKHKTQKIANWFEKKWAGVVSNVWFGVFMGSTASIGAFLGLDLDIRHITFASGNLALGLFGVDFNISGELLFWAILGIGIIGFMNFIVSFLLSLFLAFRSRNIPLIEIRFLLFVIIARFRVDPFSFFFPRRAAKQSEETEH